jgi:enterochelin esterase family protein
VREAGLADVDESTTTAAAANASGPRMPTRSPIGGTIRTRGDNALLGFEIRTYRVGAPTANAPFLVVLDGPDYVRRASLLSLVRRLAAGGLVPPHHIASVLSGDRFEDFSASARHTDALAAALDEMIGRRRGRRVGVGSSLGALALLHLHRRDPRALSGIFLQSGSFFRRRTDRQEAGFQRFNRIDRFVGSVLAATEAARTIPTTITCALDEENFANNAVLAQALATQGYAVAFHAERGGHDWPSWRRALESHLPALLRRVWR